MRTYMAFLAGVLLAGCGGSTSSDSEHPVPDARAFDARPATDGGSTSSIDAGAHTPDGAVSSHTPDAATAAASPDAATGSSTPDAPISAETPDAPISAETPDAPISAETSDAPVVVVVPPDAPAEAPFHDVVSSLSLGSSAKEAAGFAFDLDGDGTVDDKLNQTVISLAGLSGIDLNGTLHDLLAQGTFVILGSLHADSLTTEPSATWQLFVGDPQPSPDFSGHGHFTISDSSPRDIVVSGSIAGGHFSGTADQIVIDAALSSGPTLRLTLVGAHLEADVTASGCSHGHIGGALPTARLETDVFPAVAAALTTFLAAHPTNLFVALLDSNSDGTITAHELATNPAVTAFFAPDVDLLDAEGHPGHDGVRDSLSLALGVSCVGAVYSE